MPRYRYHELSVRAGSERHPFDPRTLRPAVEYLKTLPQEGRVRLVAIALIEPGVFKVNAPASLTLDQITGHTAAQVWDMLDDQIEEQFEYFKRRSG